MQLEVHEIATLFPTMAHVDLEQLRESIGKEGQIEEVLVFEGKILDGRHRYQVCRELGIEPRLRTFEGTAQEAFAHSVALNLSRRHLTTVQRAAAGAGLKEFQARLLAGDDADEPEAPAAERAAPSFAPFAGPDVEAESAPDPGADSSDDGAPPRSEEVAARAAKAPALGVHEDAAAPERAAEPAESSGAAGDEAASDADEAAQELTPSGRRRRLSPRTINARAREIASQRVGVSGRTIDSAAKVKDEAPDVFERMLAGTAGSMPDVKRVTALPKDVREKVHALVDDGVKLKAALKQVSPPAPSEDGALFLGKVTLEREQAQAFQALVEARGIKRADAAREALLDWISKHEATLAEQGSELVGAP